MIAPDARVGPVEASSLCRECGICCGWPIFAAVVLAPDEVAWASSKRLPLVQHEAKLSFRLPCSVLEARGDERVCGDYAHRPAACRAFECKVLIRYKNGELPREDALDLVRRARALIASVEDRVEGTAGTTDVGARKAALSDVLHQGTKRVRTLDAETLLDIGVLEKLVLPAFHEPRWPEKSTAGDVQALLDRAMDRDEWERLLVPLG